MSIIDEVKYDLKALGDEMNEASVRKAKHWTIDRIGWLMNGSYGEEYATKWLRRIKEAVFNQKPKVDGSGWPALPTKRLRSAVIEMFQELMALEYDCSRGHMTKCIKAAAEYGNFCLAWLTVELMNEVLDELNDYIDESNTDGHYHVYLCGAGLYEVGCN